MKTLARLIAGALLLATASVHAAGGGYPPGMPKFGAEGVAPPLAITRKTLANGLEVWVVPRKGAPRVSFALALRNAGFVADAPAQPGFATLLAELLSGGGTTKRDSRALAEEAQRLGGSVSAAAANDGLTISATALASQTGAMMQLLAEVVRQPAFPAGEVQLAKANALQSLKAAQAQPGYRADRALARATFGEHPYARTRANEASIDSVTVEGLKSEHTRRFRPDHALLVVAGGVTPDQALKLAAAAFDDWKADGPPLPDTPAAPTTATAVRVLLDRPGSVQATVRLGRPGEPASASEGPALALTNAILGAGFSSRINMNLREDKGYTYGASARHRGFRSGGAVTGGADVRNEVTGASIQEFLREYQRIGTEPVPAEELAMNKRYVAGSYLIGLEKQGSVAQQLANNWLIGLPADYVSSFAPAVLKVSAAQVRALAAKLFSPQTQAVVVVGDRAAVAEQLKAFGDFKAAAE